MRRLSLVIVLLGLFCARAEAQSCAASGDSCDDGLYCTVGDTCNASLACVGLPRACTDFIACTTDSCNETNDTCDYVIASGKCQIGGGCYDAGERDPTSVCRVCDPTRATEVWSAVENGTPCDDGLTCTDGDVCLDASCVSGEPRRCDDGLACTEDHCDESTDACTHATYPGFCLIAGACKAAGEIGPPCYACLPDEDQSNYSPAPVETPCGSARCEDGILEPTDECDGAGTCLASSPQTCPSGRCFDTTMCGGPCAADAHCPAAAYCSSGMCKNDEANGAVCDRPGQCLSGACVGGKCQTASSGDDGCGCHLGGRAAGVPGAALLLLWLVRRRR